jgi:hypothetical protein
MICPLCQHILMPVDHEVTENTYPNIARKRKKLAAAMRIYAFAAIVAEAILVYCNLKFYKDTLWCLITGAAILYAYLTIFFCARRHTSKRMKILFQTCSGVLFVILIDYLLGFQAWSVTYVLPFAIFVLDVIIFILMLINRKTYESYLWIQIFLMAICVIPMVLHYFGFVVYLRPACVVFVITVVEFLGTVLIGGQKAYAELQRRFHV